MLDTSPAGGVSGSRSCVEPSLCDPREPAGPLKRRALEATGLSDWPGELAGEAPSCPRSPGVGLWLGLGALPVSTLAPLWKEDLCPG